VKLCQFQLPGRGRRVGLVEGDSVIDVTSPGDGITSVLDLVNQGRSAAGLERLVRRVARRRARPRYAWRDLDRAPTARWAGLLAPLDPPEVWGAGITYRRSAEYYTEHEGGHTGRTKGIYDYVYHSERPELFFKATAARSAGPHAPVGLRGDSTLTAVEAELACVVGAEGRIVGYTVGNDLSAWDIERENALFLPQSKIFQGSFAFGPVVATPTTVPDPHGLTIQCVIERGGRRVYEGTASTRDLRRRVDELVGWLVRYNPVPAGAVLSTGTGILVPDEYALQPGDVVIITIDPIGTLRNPVRRLAR
jgi:2-dehydro-3-deoxy-D-arabinonate dehydratase